MTAAVIVRAANAADIGAITAIYNHAVRHTLSIWNDTEVDEADRRDWLKTRQSAAYPVLVAANDRGEVLGYASFGGWRSFDGYRHTAEHSVYVAEHSRGRGVGRALLLALIDAARERGIHVLVAAIESENAASLALHHSLGFVQSGHMPQVGTKFGRWLDLLWLQKQLDYAPPPPTDD